MLSTHIPDAGGILRLPANPRGRDVAVGDIHGHFSRLREALDRYGFDPARDRLFSVGDLIDRGPQSESAVAWLDEPWFFAVQGNHEDLAVRHVRNGRVDQDNWRRYGGGWFLDLPPERQRVLARRYEALPVVIELATAAGTVGLLHADSPVRDWSRLAGTLRAHRRRARGAPSGRATGWPRGMLQGWPMCGRWWPATRPCPNRWCWATSTTSTQAAGRMKGISRCWTWAA